MQKWLKGDPNCLLPCWAGITPGKTTWQEAKQILGEVVDFARIDESGTCINKLCNLIEWQSRAGMDVRGYLIDQANGSIYSIIVKVSKPTSIYRLDQILSQYGPPGKVFLHVTTAPGTYNELSLTLAYPNHQFIITYTWLAVLFGENVVSCFQDGTAVSLFVKPIPGEWTDDLIKNEVYGNTEIDAIAFKSLQDATDMTIDQFYSTFKNIKGGECIRTPIKT